METKMSRQGRLRMAATLICVACASAAGAQLASDGGNNLPHPRTQAASCAEVAWDKGLLALYPQIGDGCQEVVIAEGLKWARFEAELVRVYGDGRVTLDFKDRQGRSIEPISLLPASGQRVSIEGRTYAHLAARVQAHDCCSPARSRSRCQRHSRLARSCEPHHDLSLH